MSASIRYAYININLIINILGRLEFLFKTVYFVLLFLYNTGYFGIIINYLIFLAGLELNNLIDNYNRVIFNPACGKICGNRI